MDVTLLFFFPPNTLTIVARRQPSPAAASRRGGHTHRTSVEKRTGTGKTGHVLFPLGPRTGWTFLTVRADGRQLFFFRMLLSINKKIDFGFDDADPRLGVSIIWTGV